MSEALSVELVSFDDPPRNCPPSAHPMPLTDPSRGEIDRDAPARIGRALADAGIHVPSTLYNEALALARDGHLGQAQARLVMLTCLDPDDGDALLLLSRVHAAQGRWGEALMRLDAAVSAGGFPAAGYREALEDAIRGERAREEEQRARIAAREQGEMRQLRNETRTLRAEQIRLETEVSDVRTRERAWKLASLAGGLFGSVVIALLVFATGSGPSAGLHTAELATAEPPMVAPFEEAPALQAPSGSATDGAAAADGADVPELVFAPAEPALEPTSAAEPREIVLPTTHVVARNDTLYKLAARYYGKRSEWTRILAANPQLGKDGTHLALGMELTIPKY